jgi:hypothetical protein
MMLVSYPIILYVIINNHGGRRRAVVMFTACLALALPKPERSNRSSGLIINSYLLNKQMIIDNNCLGLANTQDERFTPFFLVIKIKGN